MFLEKSFKISVLIYIKRFYIVFVYIREFNPLLFASLVLFLLNKALSICIFPDWKAKLNSLVFFEWQLDITPPQGI